LRSGSKKGPTRRRPPELAAWQRHVIDVVAASPLAEVATFGGATALSAVYLHHRRSLDLDFFFVDTVDPAELAIIARAVTRGSQRAEIRVVGPRHMLVLSSKRGEVGHVDFAHYPFDPIERPTRWRGLRVDSLVDMTVNKVQAVLTRARERDFVDLFFLLREGPERDIDRLLSFARAKFDVAASTVTLAESLLRVEDMLELPDMLRPVDLDELRSYFVELARELVRHGPR
jgi:predicted nucleotidyltransferase component of viral defense system